MKRSLTVAFVAAVLLLLPGCYAMNIDASVLEPSVYLSLDPDRPQPERISEFETQETGSWLLWGLVQLGEPDIDEALQREIRRANGTAVTGIEIKTQQTVIDGLVSLITLGIYSQRSTIVRGTVVR